MNCVEITTKEKFLPAEQIKRQLHFMVLRSIHAQCAIH